MCAGNHKADPGSRHAFRMQKREVANAVRYVLKFCVEPEPCCFGRISGRWQPMLRRSRGLARLVAVFARPCASLQHFSTAPEHACILPHSPGTPLPQLSTG